MDDEKTENEPKVSISVGNISSSGPVAVGGGDVSINVFTGGDVDQSKKMIVGGVSTTQEKAGELESKLNDLENNITTEELPEEQLVVARKASRFIRKQLLSKNKPNIAKLIKACNFIKRLSPKLAKATLAIFVDPLAVEIISNLGEKSVEYLSQLRR